MAVKERIPLLKDHHTHPFLYSALASCPDLRFIDNKQKALELIGAGCDRDVMNAVIGWNDSSYLFT